MGNNESGQSRGYEITTKTGDKKGMGADVEMFVAMTGENGRRSKNLYLDCKWRDDFEAGAVDSFSFDEVPDIGPIITIEVARFASCCRSKWFLEWLEIKNHHRPTDPPDIFPFQRWVDAGVRFSICRYDCVLPQFDAFPGQRQLELDRKRNDYVLAEKAPGMPKQVLNLPDDENFSNSYKWDILSIRSALIIRWKMKSFISPRLKSISDIDKLYNGCFAFPYPYGKEMWRNDNNFGRQRLQGCNPISICRCDKIPETFGVTSEMVEPFLQGQTLEEAMDKNNIYIVDHSFMKGLQCTDNRKVTAPFALFYVNAAKELMPLAIQLFPNSPRKQHAVFLPSDPNGVWTLAKMYFNNADSAFHQSCTHLAFTHLIMEGIAVVCNRELSPSHPVYRLLAPHFLFLMAINSRALAKLVSPGGWVDTSMTVGSVGLKNIIRKKFDEWRMDVHGWLPKDLENRGLMEIIACYGDSPETDAARLYHYESWKFHTFYEIVQIRDRGLYRDFKYEELVPVRGEAEDWNGLRVLETPVDDTEALPYYPYRDDALLVHKAIKDYVKEVVTGYYDTPEKLADDYEIQRWADSLVDDEGLALKGVPGQGQFKRHKHLIKVLTSIIFMGTVSHAGANFSQYDDYAFPPNYPAFLHGRPPEDKTDVSDDEILKHLPDKDTTLGIAAVTKLLSDRGTRSLGNFEKQYMYDPIGKAAHTRFVDKLQKISEIIAERNESRPEKYPYLDPKEIPNSISI